MSSEVSVLVGMGGGGEEEGGGRRLGVDVGVLFIDDRLGG